MLLCLLSGGTLAIASRVGSAGASSSLPDWQTSASIGVVLGCRLKAEIKRPIMATFEVFDPGGQRSCARVSVKGETWVGATFPDDFDTFIQPGRYRWRLRANGEIVNEGRFEFVSHETCCDGVVMD